MATATEQTHCDRCRAPIAPGAAYCEECGERTRRARRNVRFYFRIEMLFLALVLVSVFGFFFISYFQK